MSFIKDLTDLDYLKKSFIISIPVLTCFWYVPIFLFNTEVLTKQDFFVSFVFAFCLAFVWCLACICYSLIALKVIRIRDEIKGNENISEMSSEVKILTVLIISTVILSIFILVTYFLKLRFIYFAISPFIVIVLLILFRLIQFNRLCCKKKRIVQ